MVKHIVQVDGYSHNGTYVTYDSPVYLISKVMTKVLTPDDDNNNDNDDSDGDIGMGIALWTSI